MAEKYKPLRRLWHVVISALFTLSIAAACAYLCFHCSSWTQATSALNGRVLFAINPKQCIENMHPGDVANVGFQIKNLSLSDITIFGAETDCGCSLVEDLPKTIHPGECDDIILRIQTFGQDAGTIFTRKAYLIHDGGGPPVTVSAKIHVSKITDDLTFKNSRAIQRT